MVEPSSFCPDFISVWSVLYPRGMTFRSSQKRGSVSRREESGTATSIPGKEGKVVVTEWEVGGLVTSSRVYTQWHMAQSPEPSLWPLVTGIYPIPSAGSASDDLFFFLHAFISLITFGFNS